MTGTPMVLMTDEEVAGYGRNPDAGFGGLETERGLLPLIAMAVDARVTGIVATVEVAQTFVNTTGVAIETTYIFPLPDRAAVHRFSMEVGGRVIDGVIDERAAARQHYDEAIATGHRAAITEQDRPGVFTLRVGNLMPGEAATVRLALVGPLPIDDGEVTFRFPLVVAPRYIPGRALGGEQAGLGSAPDTDLVPDASRISPPVRLPGCPDPVRLSIRVALDDGVMRDVVSSLHAVVASKRDAQIIELVPGERIDRDFLLRWRVDGDELRSSLVCADDAGGGAGSFVLTIVPPSTASVAAKPRDVVFVIDRSGSMGGWKMVAARRAAARMIDTLTSRDRFCAIAFDDRPELLPEASLVDATDRNRFRAVEALAKLEARGGTELGDPLQRALGMLVGGTADRERLVMLVTDGQVGNEDHILRELAPRLHHIKMFTLGIDQAVNAGFLRRLAAAGGGLCELVESEDRLDAVMAKVHRRIGTPIATELALQMPGFDVDRESLAPAKLPDVYAGAPVVVFGRYRGPAPVAAAIEVLGTSLGDPLRMSVPRTTAPGPVGGPAATWLAASWARVHIRDLEDRYAAKPNPLLEQQIVRVSTQFSVLSRFTAFLAVDRGRVVNPGGAVRQVVQPVETPAGWSPGAPANRARGMIMQSYGGGQGARAARHDKALPAMAAPGGSSPMSPPAPLAARAAPRGGSFAPAGSSNPIPLGGRSVASGRVGRGPSFTSGASGTSGTSGTSAARGDAGDVSSHAYLVQLASLAHELERWAAQPGDTTALRRTRQRFTQWIEDVRSVGGLEPLAAAVEALIQRLSEALAAPAELAGTVIAITQALQELSTGSPPIPPKATSRSRRSFWK